MGDELIWEAIPKSKLAPWRNTIAKYIDCIYVHPIAVSIYVRYIYEQPKNLWWA